MSTPRKHDSHSIQAPPLGETAGRAAIVVVLMVAAALVHLKAWLIGLMVVAVFGGPTLIAIAIAAVTTHGGGSKRRE